MKVYLASDHTGINLKAAIKAYVTKMGHEPIDCGAMEFDAADDYPDFISKAAEKVSHDPENSLGIIMGGSGQGEAMVANKFKNVRCAVFYALATTTQAVNMEGKMSQDPFEIVRLSREHNNANMLSLSARFLREEQALTAVDVFLSSPSATEERHIRRIEKIKKLEE